MYRRATLRLIIHRNDDATWFELDGHTHENPEVLQRQMEGCGWPSHTNLMIVKADNIGVELARIRLNELADFNPDRLPI